MTLPSATVSAATTVDAIESPGGDALKAKKRANRKSLASSTMVLPTTGRRRNKEVATSTIYEKIPSLLDDDDDDDGELGGDEEKNSHNGHDDNNDNASDDIAEYVSPLGSNLKMMPVASPSPGASTSTSRVKGILNRAKAVFSGRSSRGGLASSTLFASAEPNAVECALSDEQRRAVEVAHFRATHNVPRVDNNDNDSETCNEPADILAGELVAAASSVAVAAKSSQPAAAAATTSAPPPVAVATSSLDEQADELMNSMPLDWHLFEKRELFALVLGVVVRSEDRATHVAFVRDAIERKRVAHAVADAKAREGLPDTPLKSIAMPVALPMALPRHSSEVVSNDRRHRHHHHHRHEPQAAAALAVSSPHQQLPAAVLAMPLPRAVRPLSRPTMADLARAGDNVLPLLWLSGDVRARIAAYIGHAMRSTIAQLSKSNLMLSRHYEVRLRAPSDCGEDDNFAAYRQLVNEARVIVAMTIFPVPDHVLSLLCTRAVQQNCLRTLSIHDSSSPVAYIGLSDLSKLTTLERVELRDLFDGIVLIHLYLPRSVRHLSVLGRQSSMVPLSSAHRALHLARVITDIAPFLETLRVRNLAGVQAEVGVRHDEATCVSLSHAAVSRFARLKEVDSDVWPMAWLAVVGAAGPTQRRGIEALGAALRVRAPLLKAIVNVEREAYYWGGLPREECDSLLARSPIGSYLVRYSDRSLQLVVSYNDVALRRPRHVLVDATERGLCWETDRTSYFQSMKALLAFYPDAYIVPIDRNNKASDDDDTDEAWEDFIGDDDNEDDPNFWL